MGPPGKKLKIMGSSVACEPKGKKGVQTPEKATQAGPGRVPKGKEAAKKPEKALQAKGKPRQARPLGEIIRACSGLQQGELTRKKAKEINAPDILVSSRLDPDPGNHGALKQNITLQELIRRMGPPEHLRLSPTIICRILRIDKNAANKSDIATIAQALPHNIPRGGTRFSSFTYLCEADVAVLAKDLERLGKNVDMTITEADIPDLDRVATAVRKGVAVALGKIGSNTEFNLATHGGMKLVETVAGLILGAFPAVE